MRSPVALSRCALCCRTLQRHVCGERRLCPDGSARVFTARPKTTRAAQSFSVREVEWLASVLLGIEERRDVRRLAGTRECGRIARKVRSMKAGTVSKGGRA